MILPTRVWFVKYLVSSSNQSSMSQITKGHFFKNVSETDLMSVQHPFYAFIFSPNAPDETKAHVHIGSHLL